MPFTKDKLALSYFVELTDTHKRHFEMSGCRRALVPYSLAVNRPGVLDYFGQRGTLMTVRMDVDPRSPGVTDRLLQNLPRFRNQAVIENLIVANDAKVEPENGFDMHYGSPSWGNSTPMWSHRAAVGALITRLREAGYDGHPGKPRIISTPFTNRAPRATSVPWPGTMRWWLTCWDTYMRADGRACHVYTDNYRGPVDLERLQWCLQMWATLWDPPLIVDELGINNGTDTERVAGYLALADWLLRREQQEEGAAGHCVDLLAIFAGSAGAEFAEYVLRSDQAYTAIRRWREAA